MYEVLTHNLQNNEYTVIITGVELAEALAFLKAICPKSSHVKSIEYVLREI